MHRNKFKQKYENNRLEFKEKFYKKYGVELTVNALSDILLYESIEKRGFLILLHGKGEFTCKEEIILNGDNVTKKN
jgi:hypothetical protein